MASRATIDDFLAQRRIAVVGVSRNPKDFSNSVYRTLRDGRALFPVNRSAAGSTLEGDQAYAGLADLPGPVDGVLVMVPAADAAQVVRDAVAAGVPRVWLHRGMGCGAVSDEAVALCREHGVAVVDGACPLMFDAPVTGIHRMHRFFAGKRVAA